MNRLFNQIAGSVSAFAGQPHAFVLALVCVLVWAVTGPMFQYSETWQLVINTGTTIVTSLMVFLVQNSQNRDAVAMQAKLDELIRVSQGENHFIGIEHLPEEEVEEFRKRCEEAARDHVADEVRTRTSLAGDRQVA